MDWDLNSVLRVGVHENCDIFCLLVLFVTFSVVAAERPEVTAGNYLL